MNKVTLNGKPFHFIGIGGIGMSALAYILAKRQLPVSGSDIRASHITQRLQSVGTHIFNTQDATNLDFFRVNGHSNNSVIKSPTASKNGYTANGNGSNGSSHTHDLILPQIICSTAINADNDEYIEAQKMGCPIFHRSDVLAALIEDFDSIAVAGTHGKTTTSSLIGYMLLKAGLDPTIIVGGEVNAWEGNARLGDSNFLVAEADESDGSLIKHCPKIGIVTNIELDHPDHFQSLTDLITLFQTFATQCETVIACLDCETVRTHLKADITYSLNPELNADYTVKNVVHLSDSSVAQVWERGQLLGQMRLALPGKHNLANALSAVAAGRNLGLDFAVIAEAIASFEGAKRRFEFRGSSNGITFIDDYGHHPSEIKATLAGARLRMDNYQASRLVAIFQPHRYSRTAAFFQEFAQSFTDADLVVVTDIYSAGETNVYNISGEQVTQAIALTHPQVHYHSSLETLKTFLQNLLKEGDLALFLGAGNLNQVIPELIA